MKHYHYSITLSILVALTLTPGLQAAGAPLGTAFTYQGRLLTSYGAGVNGSNDMQFGLYTNSSGSSLVGSLITNAAVAFSNGLFTTTLDFGAGVFDGTTYWLEVGLRAGGSGTNFSLLSPRQRLAVWERAGRVCDLPSADRWGARALDRGAHPGS